MSVTVQSLKCPECGAPINMDYEKEVLFCAFCGAPLKITNDNETVRHTINHTINDADIIHAEAEKTILMKKLAMQEKKENFQHKLKIFKIIVLIIWVIIEAVCAVLISHSDSKGLDNSNFAPAMIMMIGMIVLMAVGFSFIDSNTSSNATSLDSDIDYYANILSKKKNNKK